MGGETLLSIKGTQGRLEVYEDKVVIDRTKSIGLQEEGIHILFHDYPSGRKEIPLSEVTGVTVAEAQSFWFRGGYIHIHQRGYDDQIKGARDARTDENSLTKRNISEFKTAKQKIEQLQGEN